MFVDLIIKLQITEWRLFPLVSLSLQQVKMAFAEALESLHKLKVINYADLDYM